MKTSKKMIIAFFAVIFIIIVYTAVNVRIRYEGFERRHELPSFEHMQDIVSDELKLEHFNKLVVDFPGHIFYRKGNESVVKFEMNQGSKRKFSAKVKNGVLFLNYDAAPDKNNFMDIYIFTDSLVEIKLNNHCWFDGDFLVSENLEIHAHNSTFHSEVRVNNMVVNASDKSRLTVEGQCNGLILELRGGSVFNAIGMNANNAKIEGYNGSSINMAVENRLDVHLENNSMLNYKGNPDIRGINVNSGSKVLKYGPEDMP